MIRFTLQLVPQPTVEELKARAVRLRRVLAMRVVDFSEFNKAMQGVSRAMNDLVSTLGKKL